MVVDYCINTIFFDLEQTLVELSNLKLCMYNALKKYITQPNIVLNELMYEWGYKTHELFIEYREKKFIDIIELHILGLKDVLNNYEIKISDGLANAIVKEVWYSFIENNRLYPNTKNVLEKLKKLGYKLGLITNSELNIVNGVLQKQGITHFFDVKVISGVVKVYKPNPLLFKIAIDLAKCAPSEGIYVGDSEVDIKGANKVGLITVIVHRDEIPDPCIGIIPNYRINSLLKLPDLVSKINKIQTLKIG